MLEISKEPNSGKVDDEEVGIRRKDARFLLPEEIVFMKLAYVKDGYSDYNFYVVDHLIYFYLVRFKILIKIDTTISNSVLAAEFLSIVGRSIRENNLEYISDLKCI